MAVCAGETWIKPLIGQELKPYGKTNIVLAGVNFDSSTVWVDPPDEHTGEQTHWLSVTHRSGHGAFFTGFAVYKSADGIHWNQTVVPHSGPTGDRATIFKNPFRNEPNINSLYEQYVSAPLTRFHAIE